jgi:hypothetical protein
MALGEAVSKQIPQTCACGAFLIGAAPFTGFKIASNSF